VRGTPPFRFLVVVLAVAAGASVGNLWLIQPLLPAVARDFSATPSSAGVVATLTQVGYGLGLLFFVPLGDVVERRRLMLVLLGAVTVALLAAAAAPTLTFLAAASLAIGATTVVPQLAVPLAAHLARPSERGRAVGTVMGGLLVGLLLVRTASGLLGAAFGWRAVYLAAAALMVVLAAGLRVLLPVSRAEISLPYRELVASLGQLTREEPVLREAAVMGGLGFAAFTAFWSALAFLLETRHHLGADVAGLFGLLGAAGAMSAPVLGRMADRTSPRTNGARSLGVALLGVVVLAAAGRSLVALGVGLVLLDLGVQANHVSQLARVHSLRPEARSRLTTIYMVSYFTGGALGTMVGTYSWSVARWTGVCVSEGLFLVAALVLWAVSRREGGRRRGLATVSLNRDPS
jgi:predicted MFS family arabinose efflux permease